MSIDVSEIAIMPIKPVGSLVAFVGCVIDRKFYIGGIALHSDAKSRSFRLTYPVKQLGDGKQVPLFHPIERNAGEAIQKAVIAEWERLIQ